MFPILLVTALSCADANWIAEGIITSEHIPAETKVELLEVVLDGCIIHDDAKARLKERVSTLLLWRKPMAKVTYRGVEYDSEEYNAKVVDEAAKRERHELMYRGIKVKSKASPCS